MASYVQLLWTISTTELLSDIAKPITDGWTEFAYLHDWLPVAMATCETTGISVSSHWLVHLYPGAGSLLTPHSW